MSDKGQRHLNLIAALLRSPVPMTKQEILASVEGYADANAAPDAVERKFERDKTDLHGMGIELVWAERGDGEKGYRVDAMASLLPAMRLTVEERLVLEQVAERTVHAGTTSPLTTALQSALNKLKIDNPPPGLGGADDDIEFEDKRAETHPPPMRRQSQQDPEMEARLTFLNEALHNRHAVRFQYRRPDQPRPARRAVQPFGLALVGGFWYLVGNDLDRQDLRVFKLARMEGKATRVKGGMPAEYAVPDDFDLHATVQRLLAPAGQAGALPHVVRLRVDPTVAFMAATQLPHDWCEWPDGPEGALSVAMPQPFAESLWQFIARYAPHVEVLAPAAVRTFVADRAQAVLTAGKEGHGDGD